MNEIKIVFVGHVDHGKSTVIGRLLFDTNSLPEGVVKKVQRIADETGKPFEYAYLLDAFEEEQQQGITIDTTQRVQEQSKRHAYMLSLLGIGNVSVLVNKMDLVGFEQSTFDRIVADIKNFLRPLGVELNKFIPVSKIFALADPRRV